MLTIGMTPVKSNKLLFADLFYFDCIEENTPEEAPKTTEKSLTVIAPVEHHEEQQETIHTDSSFEKPTNERSESDTGRDVH